MHLLHDNFNFRRSPLICALDGLLCMCVPFCENNWNCPFRYSITRRSFFIALSSACARNSIHRAIDVYINCCHREKFRFEKEFFKSFWRSRKRKLSLWCENLLRVKFITLMIFFLCFLRAWKKYSLFPFVWKKLLWKYCWFEQLSAIYLLFA